MLILGIETATPQVSIAIGGHDGVVGVFEVSRGRRHAETVVPAIEFLCRQADVDVVEFGAIAVDVGPGLFTGMRVGLSTGMAMAHALRVPMVGVTSLELLAHPLRFTERVVASVIDARKGEVFYSFHRAGQGIVQRLTEPRVGSVDDLIADLLDRGQETICVGDGAVRYRGEIEAGVRCEFADDALAFPSAGPLVQIAQQRVLRDETADPAEVQPLYLRAPDAQINWSTRASA